MRFDRQSHLLHYFNLYATKDRIDIRHLSDVPRPLPADDHSTIARSLLPSSEDNEVMATNFAIHVSRVLTEHMSFFKQADTVTRHISHAYSTELAQKSIVVSDSVCT